MLTAGGQLPKAGKVTKKEDVVAESSDEADGWRSHCNFYHHSVANGLSGIQMLKTFKNIGFAVPLFRFTKEQS